LVSIVMMLAFLITVSALPLEVGMRAPLNAE